MKLYDEMIKAMAHVIEAEENAAAWKSEATERMKRVNNLIRAEEIASGEKLDKKTVIANLRAAMMPEAPAEPVEAPAEETPNMVADDFTNSHA